MKRTYPTHSNFQKKVQKGETRNGNHGRISAEI